MANNELIEQIVREVMKRLAALGVGVSTDAGGGGWQNGHAAAHTEVLSLDDRVVSTLQLERRLAGIRRLRVVRGAVITPAARDLLKDHGIEIEVSTRTEA